MKHPLAAFTLGLGLGGAAVWFGTRPSPASVSAGSPAASPVVLPAWSWRDGNLPPALPPGAIGPAIAAWRALRSPDGSPASYATRADALRVLVARLPADGFPRLLAALGAPTDEAGRHLRQIAFDAWTGLDPAAATVWAAGGGTRLRSLALQSVRAWAALDAPAAAAWACGFPDEEAAIELATPALVTLAAQDAPRALALADSRGDDFRDTVLPAVFAALAQADPAATVRAFAPAFWKNGNGLWNLREPMTDWLHRDPAAALGWLVARTAQEPLLHYRMDYLADDPAQRRAIATAFAGHARIPAYRDALVDIFFEWGIAQSTEALAWVDQLGDPDLRLYLLGKSGSHYHGKEIPQQLLPFALALPASRNRTEKLTSLLTQWAGTDLTAALAWVKTQDDPDLAAVVATSGMQAAQLAAIARDEPATAVAEWETLTDPRARESALRLLVAAWGETDPAAALQWGDEKQRVLLGREGWPNLELLRAWAQKDPGAALRWAEAKTLRMPADTRGHSSPLLSIGAWEKPAGRAPTADLLTKIQDPALRTETLTRYLEQWLIRDPKAARAWLDTHDALAPEQAAALLSENLKN